MDAWLPVVGAVVVALLGGVIAYVSNRRLSQRQARLARVDSQLEELYGPMLALTEASDIAWTTFRSVYAPDRQSFFTPGVPVSRDERDAWIAWMRTVFMPAN